MDKVALSRIYDYVDAHVPMLAQMYEKRLKGYRAMGYELESEPENDRGCEDCGRVTFGC